jgi:cardiolipin synthase C
MLVSVLLSACGTLPAHLDRPLSAALQPSVDSPLVRIAQAYSPAPTATGFRLLPEGFYSLDARIQLVRRARDSLDVQYYLIQNDRTGRLLMRNLRDAALRGVRVRLLVDDLYTSGGDPMFRGLAAFPNVEVGLFNPFCCARQNTISKYLASMAG